MKRREFLKTAGTGLAASTAVAAPAIAQSMPELKWRCTTSWPKSLDVPFGASEAISKYVAEATDNKFQIQTFAAGEIVPALQAADAVSNGTVEMCHTAAYYFIGKDPTFALYCAVPFGLNSRLQNAWFQDGGGQECSTSSARSTTSTASLAAIPAPRWAAGSARRSSTVDDLNGLKMRIGGWAGKTLRSSASFRSRLPAAISIRPWKRAPSTPPNGSALTTTRSSASTRSPNIYYYPGWWEGGTALHFFINLGKMG